MKTDQIIDGVEGPSGSREVQVMLAGSHALGVFSDEIDCIVDWRQPTPLPNAPPSVLGVVCIRGRMLTVLDTAVLLGEAAGAPRFIVALRGDEQLALAVDRAEEAIQITAAALETSIDGQPLVFGKIKHGEKPISILNPSELFVTAMRGRERRRRSF